MDANNSHVDEIIHVHHYSALAVQSLIFEVQKNPLIYNYNSQYAFSKTLIDLAWKRIVKALLTSNNNFDLSHVPYWVHCFRGLWGWIRHILVKDMQERAAQSVRIPNAQHNWLNQMVFLEPYIDLSCESSPYDRQLSDFGIQIEMLSFQSVVTGNNTIFWLSVAMESVQNRNVGISVCFRMPKTLLCCLAPFTQEVLPDENSRQARILAIEESFGPLTFFENAVHESGKQQATAIKNQTQQVLMQCSESICIEGSNSVTPITPQFREDTATIQTDDDYQYVMSFLPMLNTLEPEKKTKMKVMIIQALYKVLLEEDIQF